MTFSDDAYLLRLSSDAIPNIQKTLAATGRPTKGRVPHFENCYFHGQVLYDFACDFKSISSKWKKNPRHACNLSSKMPLQATIDNRKQWYVRQLFLRITYVGLILKNTFLLLRLS